MDRVPAPEVSRVWSTYRVQLRPDWTFDDAAAAADYLAALGVTHLYCSPYMQATPGSTHGYDVVDPTRLSDELGGGAAHARMTGALRRVGLGQVLDIVPNHMAAVPDVNPWWWDVLENGPSSRFASVFDIDWDAGEQSTVLVPVLGDHIGRVVEDGGIAVSRREGRFVVVHGDHELPVSPKTVDELLARAARRAGSAPVAELGEAFGALPPARATDAVSVRIRHDRQEALSARLAELCRDDPATAAAVDAECAAIGADPDRLERLLRRQNYRLAHWRTASEELDYRRFFNIETLAGVRVEDGEVFGRTHALVAELVADGTLDGVRVDHVDGLADPGRYVERLAAAVRGAYTVVEKILEPGEALPPWPVAGTSGYDFLNRVNNLFVDRSSEAAMTATYGDVTGETTTWDEVVYRAKVEIMEGELSAEVGRLTSTLASVCEGHRRHRDHTRRDLRRALQELVARFGVYRTYVVPGRPPAEADSLRVAEAVQAAQAGRPDVDGELLGFLGELALGRHPGPSESDFARRLQQLTAPVMAKGVEDTAFYRYHRLISLNEVGGDPGIFGRAVADFHADTAGTARAWPESMLTLSTHDTKRSADVRARLNALTQVPEAWAEAVRSWAELDAPYRDGRLDGNTEYLLYQTLVGAWPVEPERVEAFMAKATREAKVHTSWTDPDPGYDAAVARFARGVLGDDRFVAGLQRFLTATRLVERGRRSSLAQTALLLTCPGVPDIYQGSELWDLSLVDPDNRRAVDFDLRRSLLAAPPRCVPELAADEVGVSKLGLVRAVLADRRAHPGRYAGSDYVPLDADGPAVGYLRRDLAVAAALSAGAPQVILPPGRWRDLLTGRVHRGAVAPDPVAVLEPGAG